MVRCARCRNEWFEDGPGAVAVASRDVGPILGLDDAEAIDAVDRKDQRGLTDALDAVALPSRDAGAPKRRSLGRGTGRRQAGWRRPRALRRALAGVRPAAVAAAVGAAVCGLMVAERVAIVRAAPSLASLYAAVGLPVNVRGLAISGLKSVEEIEGGVPLLLVSGAVENVSGADLDVPRLRLAVTGGGDHELYAWTTVASRAKLAPGEAAPFRARLASPPADGRGVAVRFLARQDLSARAGR